MAALTGPVVLAQGGGQGGPRWAVLGFPNVTAADTFDASTLTQIPPFVTVTNAVAFASAGPAVTAALATVASNTVITINGTGMLRNSVWLFIVGE